SMNDPQSPAEAPASDDGSGVDWAAERARLLADGDNEGAGILDELLARPISLRPTAAAILDALNDRRQFRQTHSKLRVCTDADAPAAAGACERWRLLAGWATRFERWHEGRNVINFGGSTGPVAAERMYPTEPGKPKSPELTWAEAFRASTVTLVPLVL